MTGLKISQDVAGASDVWESGRIDGMHAGRSEGYHFGRCEAIMRKTGEYRFPYYNISVMFVTVGWGYPYPPLENAIQDSLSGMVRQVIPVKPDEDIAGLADHFRPDFLLVLNGMKLPPDQVDRIRQKGIRTAVWVTDDPYYTDLSRVFAPHYDYVFTLETGCVPFYQQLGCRNVHYLPLAVDRKMYYPQAVDRSRRLDICFIGSAYWYRVAFFDQIAEYLARKNVFISGLWWNRLEKFNLLRDKIRVGMWYTPAQTNLYYNSAKIVINLHRSPDDESYNENEKGIQAFSPNPRTFEVAGSGAFQLTDFRKDLGNYLTPGQEIVTYHSPADLIAKIEYYLHHEDERRAIALRALKRTMQQHTYHNRVGQLLQITFG